MKNPQSGKNIQQDLHQGPGSDQPQPFPWQLLFLGVAVLLAVIGLGLKLAGLY